MVKRLKKARDYFEKNQDMLKQLGPQFM
jgi:hypothetical protein